jgi:hypothetical protein
MTIQFGMNLSVTGVLVFSKLTKSSKVSVVGSTDM